MGPLQITLASLLSNPFAVHTGLQVADAATTFAVLAKGGVEANPLLRLSPKHPVASIVIPKLLALPIIKKASEESPEAKKVLKALNIIYMGIIANNILQMARSK